MRFVHSGFAPDYVDYLDGWERQRLVHAAVAEGVGMDYVPPEDVLGIGEPDTDSDGAGATASHAIPGAH